jgi:hypothetical protein
LAANAIPVALGALAALVCDSPALYLLAVITCGLAIAGYPATRIVAVPRLEDDAGNRFEPLGVVSIIAESATVAIALSASASGRSPVVPDHRT